MHYFDCTEQRTAGKISELPPLTNSIFNSVFKKKSSKQKQTTNVVTGVSPGGLLCLNRVVRTPPQGLLGNDGRLQCRPTAGEPRQPKFPHHPKLSPLHIATSRVSSPSQMTPHCMCGSMDCSGHR